MSSADRQTIARGAGLTLPGTLIGNMLLLGLDFYLNHRLSTADYGAWGSIRRLLTLLGLVGMLGMENALLKRIASGDPAAPVLRTALGAAVGCSGILALGLSLGAGPLGGWLGSASYAPVLLICAFTLPLSAVRLLSVTLSQSYKAVGDRVLVMFLLWPLAQFLMLFLWPNTGIQGAAIAYTAAMALGAGVAVGLSGRVQPGAWSGVFQRSGPPLPLSELLLFSWPLWLQAVLAGGYGYLDQLLLAGLRSPEAAGIYGPVATLAPLFGLGLASLNSIFAPIIAEKYAKQDRAALANLYRTVTRWALLLSLPPLLVAGLLPGVVIDLWPNGRAEAAPALQILCLSWLVCTAVGSVNYLLIMSGHSRATLWNSLPAMLLNLSLSVALAPTLGPTGAALANAGAMATANAVGLAQVWRILRLHPFHIGLVKPVLAAVPAGAVVWAVGMLQLPALPTVLLAGVGGGLTLLGVLPLLGLDEDDRELIQKLLRRFRR
ncbi:MAG TPA: oligosaccharide flippase family protein [Myxococcota bacterium]|nr:oligosaccharide flippase family protein [Myxococcota bacterium]